jgi:hypothetical protein
MRQWKWAILWGILRKGQADDPNAASHAGQLKDALGVDLPLQNPMLVALFALMQKRRAISVVCGIVVFSIASLVAARADTTISFTGNLRTDATFADCGPGCTLDATSTDGEYAQWAAVVRTFNVAAPSTMEAITFSYGGGTNGSGMAIPPGGFEPYLSLFDSVGNFLASTFSGTTCPPGANPVGPNCFDVSLDGGALPTGSYQIAISAFENMPFAENSGSGTLADGFTGLGNLPAGEDLHFAFDVILKAPTSAVPEPATGLLLAGAGVIVWLFNRKAKENR